MSARKGKVEKSNKACEGSARTNKKQTSTSAKSSSVSAVLLNKTEKGCPSTHPLVCSDSGYCCSSGYPWLCLSNKTCYQSEEEVTLKCDGLILECKSKKR